MTATVTLRKGRISVMVDVPKRLTQAQWDALGGLFTSLQTASDMLDEGKSDD